MIKKFGKSNKVSISHKSDNNIVIQDSTISNPVICNGDLEMIEMLGKCGRYDMIQKRFIDYLAVTSKTHPLYPAFSAKPDNGLHRLVSTPETEDAFKQFPKRIEGTFHIDYEKYPDMNKFESLWEYAYRTQTSLELETTAYQEYLGDIKDPFPAVEFTDGMITVISPPEFPPAVCATISSGEISIPISLRRRPCMEYGKMVFGGLAENCEFDFEFTTFSDKKRTDFTITKIPGADLLAHLQRERLLVEMSKTKHLTVKVEPDIVMDFPLSNDGLSADIIKIAPYIASYLDSLRIIENHTSCKFDLTIGKISLDDYQTALIMAASLEGKWHRTAARFDNEFRCDYNHISDNISDEREHVIETTECKISLQGQNFSADKYTAVYKEARIDNFAFIQKKRKKRKKKIPIIFKPIEGKDVFYKFCRIEGIHLVTDK